MSKSNVLRICMLVALAGTLGCRSPKAPSVALREVRVTDIGIEGVDFDLRLVAANPTDVELHGKAVAVKVMLPAKHAMGPAAGAFGDWVIPARSHTDLEVPVRVAWDDATTFLDLGGAAQDVPIRLDGIVSVSNDERLAFHSTGIVPGKDLGQAMQRLATTLTDD